MREFRQGITYKQLITFKAIYEAGNISKAAKKLGISAASVSHTLKTLEKQVQTPLFTRTTRLIQATEVGAQLYESSRFAMGDLTAAVERVCDQGTRPTGKLSLNMAKNIYDVFLKPILIDFQRAYPKIQLEITLSDALDHHVEKSIDIGFRFGQTVNENMIARPMAHGLRKVKLALFASPDYLERYGEPTSLPELSGHSLIRFRAPTSQQILPLRLHQTTDTHSEIVTLDNLTTAMVVNNTEVMVDMALQGFGIGYLMDATVEDALASGKLMPLLKAHWCDGPSVYMYYARENRQVHRVRCFLDFVNARLEGCLSS